MIKILVAVHGVRYLFDIMGGFWDRDAVERFAILRHARIL